MYSHTKHRHNKAIQTEKGKSMPQVVKIANANINKRNKPLKKDSFYQINNKVNSRTNIYSNL